MTTALRDHKLQALVERQIGATVLATRRRTLALRLWLLAGTVLAAVAAVALSQALPSAYAASEPELITLLRGMAALKAVMVVAGLGALWWRFRWPLSRPLAAGYLIGAWVLSGATMLIWQLTAIELAAALFHVAGLTVMILALRDGRTLKAGVS